MSNEIGPTRYSFATDGSWYEMPGGDFVDWFEYDDLTKERDSLVSQRDALVAALEKYGSHDGGCMKVDWIPPRGCTCGFDAALQSSRKERGDV